MWAYYYDPGDVGYTQVSFAASERRRDNLIFFKDVSLTAEARIWPYKARIWRSLADVFQAGSTEDYQPVSTITSHFQLFDQLLLATFNSYDIKYY